MRRWLGGAGAILWGLSAIGCSGLPAAAPTANEVVGSPASGDQKDFIVVDIDSGVISALSHAPTNGFIGKFQSKAPKANLTIGVGDTLQIAVIEAGGGGLFGSGAPSASGGANVGAQSTMFLPRTVGNDGSITVPFVGRIVAAGRTADDVQSEIERQLADKAIRPQAEVYIASGSNPGVNSATVAGEVNHAAVFPLQPSGNRLLDLVAEAGSARFPAYEINVHITRRGRTATALLQNVVDNPSENIYIYPGDNIYLSHDPRTFTVYGASSKVGRYPFDSEHLNLAEGVAEAGGLIDTTADPSGVFLFRFVSRQFAASIRPDLPLPPGDVIPVVFRVNLRDSDGYFLAKQFEIHDKDIILVANSDGTQLLKFFVLLRGLTGVVNDLRGTAGASSSSQF